MKPLNLDNKPCSPISSNCVVWQGPDIPCIELCTGDTVSDVVSAMATELCTVLDTLKVSNYDLTCFNLQACGPQDFQALIQFLIEKICENEGLTPATKDAPTCPDCVVSVAECFVTGTQTTMQLVDYVQLIGERVCSIITEISLINTQITDILIRLTTLENAPVPTFTVPSFTINCQIGSLLSGTNQPIDTLLEEFINSVWCDFYAVTGTVTDLTNAIGTQEPCIEETSETITKPGTTYATEYPAWVAEPNTVADSITNIWLVLCDLHTALSAGQTITVADTNTIDLELSAGDELTAKIQDTGWVNLEGFEWYSGSADVDGIRPQCRRIGNVIHFRGIAWIPLAEAGKTAAIELTSTSAYNGLTSVLPAEDNVNLDSSGVVEWNKVGGSVQSVIPSTVLSALENLDGAYRFQYPTLFSRSIDIGLNGTTLTAAGRFGIKQTGVLYFATLKDQEIPSSTGQLLVGASPLRYITSNIRAGEFIPNFANIDTDIQNLPAAGANNLVAESGFPDAAGTDVTWPFSCDAAEQNQIGGFYATLEGLTAFVGCSSTAATASCY